MHSKEEAKQKVAQLVEKFKAIPEKELLGFNEEQTKKYFIEPLFEALGWDLSNHKEVTLEENISKTRADYGFRLNEVPRF